MRARRRHPGPERASDRTEIERAERLRIMEVFMRMARTGMIVGLLFTCQVARADGVFVWRNQKTDIREPQQKALIVFDRGLEDLVLEVRYEGAPSSFGWVIPLPSRPRMRADVPRVFETLSRATQDFHPPRSERSGRLASTEGLSVPGSVEVLERARVGIYDAAVLTANRPDALERWLTTNGFHTPSGASEVFGDYIRRGWVFVALRITPDHANATIRTALASGSIQPVRFRFRAPEPVFPLRVSALGGAEAEVLIYVIASRPLVHRTCTGATWTENAAGPWPTGLEADPDSAFSGLSGGRGFLTKLRARVGPSRMEDVYFRPYDPAPGLVSADQRRRLESVAHLGWLAPPGADRHLIRFLDAHPGESQESLTALWSLGRVGGSDAEATLLDRAQRGPWLARIEAIESLARIRSRAALPVYVEGLNDAVLAGLYEQALIEACFDHLIEQGDPSCIPSLRRLGRARGTDHRPDRFRSEASLEDRLLALRAVLGDEDASDEIVRQLIAQSSITTPECLPASMRDRGTTNDYPSGMWPVLLFAPWPPYQGWWQLQRWHSLLAGRPDVHDRILRDVADSRGMPSLGRILLIGLLVRPTPAEIDRLLELARRGLGSDSLSMTFHPGRGERAVRYNVPVCTAAAALARHRAADALLALWRECPRDDPDLRGEVIAWMSSVDTSMVMSALTEYVRTEWNERASSPEYARSVVASLNPVGREIDVSYRASAINQRIAHDPKAVLPLMTDPTLSPLLRLHWIQQLPAYEARMRSLVPEARRSLSSIARIAPSDSALSVAIAGARMNLNIGDKVYREDVEPAVAKWR